MGKVVKGINDFCGWLSAAGSIWIMALMFIVGMDVVGRLFFKHPLVGTPEIVRNSIVGIAFLQIAYAMYEKRHVRTTLIVSRVPPVAKAGLDILASIIGVLVFIFVVFSNWDLTVVAWAELEFEGEGALRVPTYPIRTLVLIGSILMVWQCVQSVVGTLRSLHKRDMAES